MRRQRRPKECTLRFRESWISSVRGNARRDHNRDRPLRTPGCEATFHQSLLFWGRFCGLAERRTLASRGGWALLFGTNPRRLRLGALGLARKRYLLDRPVVRRRWASRRTSPVGRLG